MKAIIQIVVTGIALTGSVCSAASESQVQKVWLGCTLTARPSHVKLGRKTQLEIKIINLGGSKIQQVFVDGTQLEWGKSQREIIADKAGTYEAQAVVIGTRNHQSELAICRTSYNISDEEVTEKYQPVTSYRLKEMYETHTTYREMK